MGRQKNARITIGMIDRMGDLAEEASDLAAVILCARMAEVSPLDDSADYMAGTLTVLMRASESVEDHAAEMLGMLEEGIAHLRE